MTVGYCFVINVFSGIKARACTTEMCFSLKPIAEILTFDMGRLVRPRYFVRLAGSLNGARGYFSPSSCRLWPTVAQLPSREEANVTDSGPH